MATKLYPPQLEGSLPAFYKNYEDDGVTLSGAMINIPFGLNRSVSINSITGIRLRLRTTSTNTYIVSDYDAINFDKEQNIASFEFNEEKAAQLHEGQYYRAQLAFVSRGDTDSSFTTGYYSTIGVIKCVAKPKSVRIEGFSNSDINALSNQVIGVYEQDTSFGDTTEKVYAYSFTIYDQGGNVRETSHELLHDTTQDTASDVSSDIWKIFKDYPTGEILNIQYKVTTLNGLEMSSPMYRIAKMVSIDPEFPIAIHAINNYDEGYVNISLSGELVDKEETFKYQLVEEIEEYDDEIQYFIHSKSTDKYIAYDPLTDANQQIWRDQVALGNMYVQVASKVLGEKSYSGYFLITRASSQDDYFEWVNIVHFVMKSDFPSSFNFIDRTVEQGIEYKYAIQQYNIHGMYSNKIYQTDKNTGVENTVLADFEDMFLSDGKCQLKIRFNPKVSSFKNTIPEQKIETIGSKYPFIFRNGSVCYKEFPIAGLISYQMDEATMFLNDEELKQAGILEYTPIRFRTNYEPYRETGGHETNLIMKLVQEPVYDRFNPGVIKYYKEYYKTTRNTQIQVVKKDQQRDYFYNNTTSWSETKNVVRTNKDLTTENMMGERYFKLKVLDWLTNGKVKLFRSPAEGNYIVRLLNVSMTPQDPLGRMLHQFTCTGYEIAELTYDNLIALGLLTENSIISYESQWATTNIKEILSDPTIQPDEDGFIPISPSETIINSISIQDFAPGDQVKIIYDTGDVAIYVIGVTGSLDLNNDDRNIVQVLLKPNPDVYEDFERNFTYSTTNVAKTKFDAIKEVIIKTRVNEQFVGPQEDLLAPYYLRENAYGEKDEFGIVTNPISKEEGFNNIYTDLKAHHRFTYKISDDTEKFTGLNLDLLHVVKRLVIPIFAYDSEITEDTKFGVTPFGIGYINSRPLLDYLEDDEITIVDNVIYQDENNQYQRADGVNIYDIEELLQEEGLVQHPFFILKSFVFDEDENKWKSIEDGEPYQYYDCYTQEWWEPGTKYNPSFSINTLKTFGEEYVDEYGDNYDIVAPEIIGHNDIYLNELDELNLYNLEQVEQIHLGNGVVADITMQMRIVDYDIEETDEKVRDAKNEYLNAKDDFERILNNTMKNSTDIKEALAEQAELTQKLELAQEQRETIINNASSAGSVLNAAKNRAIKQKQAAWSGLNSAINDIVNILKNQSIYTSIDSDSSEKVPIIAESNPRHASYGGMQRVATAPEGEEEKQPPHEADLGELTDLGKEVFNEETAELETQNLSMADWIELLHDRFSEDSLNDTNKFNDENNFGFLYNLPSSYQTIDDDEFDFINEFLYTYTKDYAEIIKEKEQEIQKINSQIETLQANNASIIGGLVEDYDESNPPPQNTRVYYEYYKQQLENELAKKEEAYNEKYQKLVQQLLVAVMSDVEHNELLAEITDKYISNNATELIRFLESEDVPVGRIPQRKNEQKIIYNNFVQTLTNIIFDLSELNDNNTLEPIELPTSDVKVQDIIKLVNDKALINKLYFSIEDSLVGETLVNSVLEGQQAIKQAFVDNFEKEDITFDSKGYINNLKGIEAFLAEKAKKQANADAVAACRTTLNAYEYYGENNTQTGTIFTFWTAKNNVENEDHTDSKIFEAIVDLVNTNLNPTEIWTLDTLKSALTKYANSGSTNSVKAFLLDNFPIVAIYWNAYDKCNSIIVNNISTMESQLAALKQIERDPGTISRLYGTIIKEYYEDNNQALKDAIIELQELYTGKNIDSHDSTESAGLVVNSLLSGSSYKNFEDLLKISEDEANNVKADSLLDLLVDEYNKSQGVQIKRYVKTYVNFDETETSDSSVTINRKIEELNGQYKLDTTKLVNQIEDYEKKIKEYDDKLYNDDNSNKAQITGLETQKQGLLKDIAELQAKITYASTTEDIQETEKLFNSILSNVKNQGNVDILTTYIDWILFTESLLQKQIGQMFEGVNTKDEYADLLLKYINAYEKEAFEYLHYYDALPEDLGLGFQDVGGIDHIYDKPDEYWLSSYRDVLVLGTPEKTVLSDGQVIIDYNNTLIDDTSSNTYSIDDEEGKENRMTAYKKLAEGEPSESTEEPLSQLDAIFKYTHEVSTGQPNEQGTYNLRDIITNDLNLVLYKDPSDANKCKVYAVNYVDNPDTHPTEDVINEILDYGLAKYFPFIINNNETFHLGKDSNDTTIKDKDFIEDDQLASTQVCLSVKYNSELKQYEPFLFTNKVYDDYLRRGHYIIIPKNVQVGNTPTTIPDNITREPFIPSPNFDEAVKKAIENNKQVVWESDSLPITMSITLHNNLYDFGSLSYKTATSVTTENISNNPEEESYVSGETTISIEEYKPVFNSMLGLLIYEKRDAEDISTDNPYKNCIASLRTIEQEIFDQVSSFFLSSYGMSVVSKMPELQTLRRYLNNVTTAEKKYNEARSLYNQCLLVNDTQIAVGMPNDDRERITLLALLEDARAEMVEQQELAAYWRNLYNTLLDSNPALKYYELYETMLTIAKGAIPQKKEQFEIEYSGMIQKLEHYKNLLYNDEPYGNQIQKDLIKTQDIITLAKTTDKIDYNFGIAYAIEKYKENRAEGDDVISFGDILEDKKNIENILTKNYFPIYAILDKTSIITDNNGNVIGPTYPRTGSTVTYDNVSYYILYKDPKTQQFDNNYLYIDDYHWFEDVLAGNIYLTPYKNLVPLLNMAEIVPIESGVVWDENQTYFIKNENDDGYIVDNEVTQENYDIKKPTLYMRADNGGLKGLLGLLTDNGSAYFEQLKNNYLGALALYQTLYQNSQGDISELEAIEQQIQIMQLRLSDLAQILSDLNEIGEFDNDAGLDNIMKKLAEYLRILTVTYVTKVERSYGVI